MTDKNKIEVLGYGFVQLRNLSGPVRRTEQVGIVEGQEVILGTRDFDADDIDPAITARISFDTMDDEHLREADLDLCRRLLANKHTSPWEMIETWWNIKVPMAIGEQILRHRTATPNKISGRYAELAGEWYIPDYTKVGLAKKKGRDMVSWDDIPFDQQIIILNFLEDLDNHNTIGYELYQKYIQSEVVAAELCRLFLQANHYTILVYKQDLHNLMHFLALRLDTSAQYEIRVLAEAMYQLIKQYLPNSMELFDTYKRFLTRDEKKLLKSVLDKGIGLSDFNTKEADTITRIYERLTKGTI